jgi:hypothetical protein
MEDIRQGTRVVFSARPRQKENKGLEAYDLEFGVPEKPPKTQPPISSHAVPAIQKPKPISKPVILPTPNPTPTTHPRSPHAQESSEETDYWFSAYTNPSPAANQPAIMQSREIETRVVGVIYENRQAVIALNWRRIIIGS